MADAYAPALMPHMMKEGLERFHDRPCLALGDTIATYAEVRDETSRYMAALRSQGLGVGTRVAIISGNRPEVLYNMAACAMAGLCSTALHPLGSLDDHAYVLDDAGIEALVYDPTTFEELAAALKARVPTLEHLLAFGPTEAGVDYAALAATFDAEPLTVADIGPEDLNTIVYTGGTTGRPKGVLQPYRSGAFMTLVQGAEWEWPEEIRFLIATPLSHAAAAVFVPTLQRGGALYVMPGGYNPVAFCQMVAEHRITATFMVPVMIYALLDYAPADADLSSLEVLYYGASPMSPARLAEALERWGQIFFQFFGQSEAPMVLTHLKKAEHDLSTPERLASCGRPAPWLRLALLDDDDREVGPGGVGEICIRGPLVMQGYLGKPEQTEAALSGGWLHTGDVGRFDDEGFLYIVDRKKDMIVTGGFNVFPKEIEDVLSAHPAVAQVAVIGVPDERWGEAVKAMVVLRPGHDAGDALAEELTAAVKAAKGSVQAPKSVDFVDALPLTPVGKPDKKVLKARFWGEGRGVG